MLNQSEWRLFVAHLSRHPWRVLNYSAALLSLVGRRVGQRLQLSAQRDRHRGLKQRPVWLPKALHLTESSNSLRFPQLDIDGVMPEVAPSTFFAGDPEAYLAHHRWAKCTVALGNEMKASEAFSEVRTWLEMPPERNDPAWESYSCCERVVNLAMLLAAHPSLRREADEAQLLAFFSESASWIDAHLEYYGPTRTNNHLLNNGRALVVAGCVLSDDAWLSTGLAIVERLAPELFPVDGCLREGSSHYQMVVAGWLFDTLLFASLAVPPSRLVRLETLARQIGEVCARFAVILPNMDQHIGDISPDLHPRLTLGRLRLVHGSWLKKVAADGMMGEWLFAERDRSSLIGHAVRSWPPKHTTHAHADVGGFIWLYEGKVILADAGRQDYMRRPETEIQIEPAAHNTLMINGMGALPGSVLRTGLWYPRPYCDVAVGAVATTDGFSVYHGGFKRFPGVGAHHREVRLNDSGLEVIDIVDGTSVAELSIFWHFGPDWHDDTEHSVRSTIGRLAISTNLSNNTRGTWSDYDISAAYGDAKRARCLAFVWQSELPVRIHTRMRLESCAA